ncbi:DUF6961 family protein [Sphingopyxis sp. R3-92]|uniref:DUF6961 family protein n=1 Tax=Sphingopyxis sp. R3-92 TaxID=3158553 RepID=UPI003EE70897
MLACGRSRAAGSEGACSISPDEHVWACALAVERQYGDNAPMFIAARIGALALAGDSEGVMMWQRIAARLDGLAGGSGGDGAQ